MTIDNMVLQPKSKRPQDEIPDERVMLRLVEDYRRLVRIVDEDKKIIKELKDSICKNEDNVTRLEERIKKKDQIIAETNREVLASVISSKKYVHMKKFLDKYRKMNKELKGKLNEQITQNIKLREKLSSSCDAFQK
ncbi:MAG: hypothetical protein IJ647_00770 [Prevotella sp.]|nr:hypothetical protein [Prevotella sp.]